MLCIYYSSIHAGNKNEKEQARKTTLLISRGLFELEREVIEKTMESLQNRGRKTNYPFEKPLSIWLP